MFNKYQARQVSGGFELEERGGGPIEVKGKGKMQTYYLTGPMPNAPPIDN